MLLILSLILVLPYWIHADKHAAPAKAAPAPAKAAEHAKHAAPANAGGSKDPCNGEADFCRLRFDQYTFPATHNSLAYNLKYDCSKAKGLFGFFCPFLVKMSTSVNDCIFNNNPNHDIVKQLQDGVRGFDMDTCAFGKDKAIFCHAQSDTARAIGHAVDKTLDKIKEFMDQNKREVLALEFGDMTGDCKIIMPHLMAQIQAKLGPLLVEHEAGKPWPTLGELVNTNKRIAVFVGHCLKDEKNPPKWALNRGVYYRSSWHRTEKNSKNPKDVLKFAQDFCDKPNPKHSNHWRCMDFEYSPNLKEAKKFLEKFSIPKGICIPEIAKEINPLVHKVAVHCGKKFHVHRVRVDYYWLNKFIDDVKLLNKENVKKYLK